jgi:uncharacterized RDD family membrane protein YckC
MKEISNHGYHPTLFQHFSAIVFDTLAVFSLLLLASVFLFTVNMFEPINISSPLFMLYLIGVSFFYFGWSWMHGGQTIGMKLWNIYLFDGQHHQPSWLQITLRFIGSALSILALGVGFYWQYLGSDNKNWPDYFSGTELYFEK